MTADRAYLEHIREAISRVIAAIVNESLKETNAAP